jgi:hypothetical protein
MQRNIQGGEKNCHRNKLHVILENNKSTENKAVLKIVRHMYRYFRNC